jgi:hypothetical protein
MLFFFIKILPKTCFTRYLLFRSFTLLYNLTLRCYTLVFRPKAFVCDSDSLCSSIFEDWLKVVLITCLFTAEFNWVIFIWQLRVASLWPLTAISDIFLRIIICCVFLNIHKNPFIWSIFAVHLLISNLTFSFTSILISVLVLLTVHKLPL